jgi:hypothetical protein
MKYLKLFENFKEDIDSICRRYDIKNYTINKDGTIDVNGHVNLSNKSLTKIPLKFKTVTGNFSCSHNKLESLDGSPQSVGGSFFCYDNELKWLEGGPQYVGNHFNCSRNRLLSLESAPKSIGGYLYLGDEFTSFCNPCLLIYWDWIISERRDELLDMMKDYDFLRGDTINWYLLEAFFEDAGLKIPSREELEKYYKIED